jgi:squalene synthase HpnD
MPLEVIHNEFPKQEVLAIVKKSGSSFYWAMRLLPIQKREAIFAIYAFCRVVDDIADGDDQPKTKLLKLNQWRIEIENLFKGSPKNLIACALDEPLNRYGLNKEDFMAVIDGMETDATNHLRIRNLEALLLYCDQVACAVGRLSNAVFGLNKEQSWKLAKYLGEALQLTNILRDIHEDAELNRVYLPEDLLIQNGIKTTQTAKILKSPALVNVCEELAGRARNNFKQAEEISSTFDKTLIRPVIIMMKIYHRLFVLLERRGWERIDIPIKVSKLWILLLAARILLFKK